MEEAARTFQTVRNLLPAVPHTDIVGHIQDLDHISQDFARENQSFQALVTDLRNDNQHLRATSAQRTPGSITTTCNHAALLADAIAAPAHQDLNTSLVTVARMAKAPVVASPPPVIPTPPPVTTSPSTGIKQYSAPIFNKCFSGNQCD